MLNFVLLLLSLLALNISTHLKQSHLISSQVSKQTTEAIKAKLLIALPLFKSQSLSSSLKEDLDQSNDSKRKIKSVTTGEAEEIFAVFGMKMQEGCDSNKDGLVNGDELKCFNKIWQSFVIPKI